MKNLVISILAACYLVTSMGFTVPMHYCMDRLVSWDLDAVHSKKGHGCEMQKMCKKCCKDLHTTLQLDKNQRPSESAFYALQGLGMAILPLYSPLLPDAVPTAAEPSPVSKGPPPGRPLPLYLSNRVLLV